MPAPKFKILIVEDEPVMVEVIEGMLAPYGHEMVHGYDPHEAVTLAREFRPDAVITGLVMPHDGIEVATQILEMFPNCKIIIVSSALHDPGLRRLLCEEGYDERFMLTKPFTSAELIGALNLAGIPSTLRES